MRLHSTAVALLLTIAGCGDDGDALTPDAIGADASRSADASQSVDSAVVDGSLVDSLVTLDASAPDASVPDASAPDANAPDASAPDAGFMTAQHVHIYVSNTCVMSVSPTSFTVPAGQTLQLTYHNHSNDYAVDVWKSYGGGYLDLATGDSWNETYQHCFGPSPTTEYADISTACSNFRLYVYCL